jgi:hypothetical protein
MKLEIMQLHFPEGYSETDDKFYLDFSMITTKIK